MERKPYVSAGYQERLDNLAGTLASDRVKRIADRALEDTIEFPAIAQDTLFDLDDENIVRGQE